MESVPLKNEVTILWAKDPSPHIHIQGQIMPLKTGHMNRYLILYFLNIMDTKNVKPETVTETPLTPPNIL
jgi:hypothetical protein